MVTFLGMILIEIFKNPLVWLLLLVWGIVLLWAYLSSPASPSSGNYYVPPTDTNTQCTCKDCKRLIEPGHVKHSDFDGRTLCESCYNKDIGRIVMTNHFR